MDKKKIARLRRRVEELRRRGGVHASELERLASAVGRKQFEADIDALEKIGSGESE